MTTNECTSKYGRDFCRNHGSKIPEIFAPKAEIDAKLAQVNAEIFSTHSRSVLRRLEVQREALALDAAASEEGITELYKRVLASKREDFFRYADEQQLSEAKVHRAERLTEVAISDYKAGGTRNYDRLFYDTGVEVREHGTHVYFTEEGGSDSAHHSISLAADDFDAQVIALREQVGKRQADAARYGLRSFDLDLTNTALYITEPLAASTRQVQYVNDKVSGEVIAKVEFNQNGAFQKATVGHSSGDGSVTPISSAAGLRNYLADRKAYRKLPGWVHEEHVPGQPVAAAEGAGLKSAAVEGALF